MINPSEIYVLGTGPLAEELWGVALDSNVAVTAFVENLDRSKAGKELCGRPIIWVDDLTAGSACVCALSTTKRRMYIEQVAGRAVFPNLIHPSAVILPGVSLGTGVIISAGVIVASHAVIGDHVFCNRGARIGHHTRLDPYVTVQPGANMGGFIRAGRAAFIGMGAVVIERLNIGEESTIAAGSVVIRDVLSRTMVAGNPAEVKKENVDAR